MGRETAMSVAPVAVGVAVVIASIAAYIWTRSSSSPSSEKQSSKQAKQVTGSKDGGSAAAPPKTNYSDAVKATTATPRGAPVTLEDAQKKYALKLIAKDEISHDTKRFVFELPSPRHCLGLPVGQHIQLSAQVDGELVVRSYTPVTSDDDLGHVDLIVKVYYRNVHPKFPEGGKMSQHLDALAVGDRIDVRGPAGRITYEAVGRFAVKKLRSAPAQRYDVRRVSMIAGGTGITPMLQLVRHIVKTPGDGTQLRLLFANQTEKDILVRAELEAAAAAHPDRFQLWYTLDMPPEGWKYSSGFINEEMIREHLFPAADDHIVLMCGPPPMIKFACMPALEKLGHKNENCIAY